MGSKKGDKGKVSSEKSVLSVAIKDIETEINVLAKEKANLRISIENLSGNLTDSRKLEEELQEKIARLAEKEAKLSEKKKVLESKFDGVSDKLSKISKIKSEMSSL